MSQKSLSTSLLDLMTFGETVFLLEFLAAQRYVGSYFAFTTADFLAFRVTAAKLLVHFDGWTLGSEITERTLFQIGNVRFS